MSAYDLVAVSIALVTACALIITTATANARLTRSRNEWRRLAIRQCSECGNQPSR